MIFFFFKQKTAYEMRISDWSSDVCSSDLARGGKPAAASAAPASQDAILKAADASIRAMMLIRTYRVRGHLAANLDPLGLSEHEMPDDLRIDYHGFAASELDEKIYPGGYLGLPYATRSDKRRGGQEGVSTV